jgi:chemotaxis protein methyltransferase CheR
MAKALRVLLLEDDEDDALLLERELQQAGFHADVHRIETEDEYRRMLGEEWDIILADYTLPGFGAPRALELLSERELDVPFVVVTGSVGEERAVACMRSGASDYLLKDRLARLGPAITRALAAHDAKRRRRAAEEEVARLKDRLEAENTYLQQEIKLDHDHEHILGQSPIVEAALKKVRLVAPTKSTVLIMGETGSGKELFARAIHDLSPRRDRPLVKVNCAALPDNLIESELFGHEAGAFTGALKKHSGRFELADQGTLFLDEVGELPVGAQAKLLRVLQEEEFERVGGERTRQIDVRVIAATNRSLEQAVDEGSFRADLDYRLSVFPLRLPALRERLEDLDALIQHFTRRAAKRVGKPMPKIPAQELAALKQYPWPGNVRELQNVVERAVILSEGGVLKMAALVSEGKSDRPRGETIRPSETRLTPLSEVEQQHIRGVLEHTGWKIEGPGGAAEILGLKGNTLRSRMQKLGIEKPWRKPRGVVGSH